MSMTPDEPPGGDNPYAAPTADFSGGRDFPQSEAEKIRHQHLGHEQYIRALSLLAYSVAACFFLAGATILLIDPERLGGPSAPNRGESQIGIVVLMVGSLLMGGLNLYTGLGLRAYEAMPRALAIVGSGVAMSVGALAIFAAEDLGQGIAACMCTGVFGACLYALLNAKAWRIFTPEYREIVAQTPQIRPRSGCLPILMGIIVIIAVGGIVGSLFEG